VQSISTDTKHDLNMCSIGHRYYALRQIIIIGPCFVNAMFLLFCLERCGILVQCYSDIFSLILTGNGLHYQNLQSVVSSMTRTHDGLSQSPQFELVSHSIVSSCSFHMKSLLFFELVVLTDSYVDSRHCIFDEIILT